MDQQQFTNNTAAPHVAIRPATGTDVEAVLSLTKAFATSFCIEELAFRTSYAALQSSSNAFLAVADSSGVVVGYVLAFRHDSLYANGPLVWVEEITITPEFQRQGIGRALMESAENWAREGGCTLVALATRRAADFYEALGYEASATYHRKLI